MIAGLDGTHRWNDEITLNDITVWPRYRIRRIPGLHTLPERELVTDPATGRIGELPRRSPKRGKSIVYEGQIEARNQAELIEARDALIAAFSTDDTGEMVVNSFIDPESPEMWYEARVAALDPPEELPSHRRDLTMGYKRNFTLGLRLHDPRFYSTEPKEGITSDLSPGGGTAPPFTPPFTLAPGDTSIAVASVENMGNAPTPFVADLYGPGADLELVDLTRGWQIKLKNINVANGEFIQVNFRTRQILLNGTNDLRYKFDRVNSTWWDPDAPDGLWPGATDVRFGGRNLSGDARAEIRFFDAYWG